MRPTEPEAFRDTRRYLEGDGWRPPAGWPLDLNWTEYLHPDLCGVHLFGDRQNSAALGAQGADCLRDGDPCRFHCGIRYTPNLFPAPLALRAELLGHRGPLGLSANPCRGERRMGGSAVVTLGTIDAPVEADAQFSRPEQIGAGIGVSQRRSNRLRVPRQHRSLYRSGGHLYFRARSAARSLQLNTRELLVGHRQLYDRGIRGRLSNHRRGPHLYRSHSIHRVRGHRSASRCDHLSLDRAISS